MRKTTAVAAAACAAALAAAPAQAANSLSAEIYNSGYVDRIGGAAVATAQFGAVNDAGTIRTQQITVTRPFDRYTPLFFRALALKSVWRTVRISLQPANTARSATWCFDNLLLVSDQLTETEEKLTFRAPTTYALSAFDSLGQNAFSAGYGGKC